MRLEEMSARSTDKQPKIKGLVKRCRSFKEDIMSRLARNRSLAKDDGGKGGRRGGSGSGSGGVSGWTSGGTSPIPNDPDIITDPIVLIAHRLKEAYLTLQFVESLIQKNCVDLLGGSSNVMLDLMGHLLNDIKGLTALSHTAAYQSTVSQLKSALGDFLTAVDVLLLKERADEVQKELYFEKVLDTLKTTREALARLKSLVESKENGNHHYTNSVRHHSTSCAGSTHTHTTSGSIRPQPHPQPLLASTPTNRSGSSSRQGLGSPGSKSDGLGSPFPLSPLDTEPHPLGGPPIPPSRSRSPGERGEKRPPLPPKLRQWTAKSFDSEWPPPHRHHPPPSTSSTSTRTISPAPHLPSSSSGVTGVNSSSTNLSPHHQSLLAAWLEQSSGPTTTTPTSSHHHHHHRSHSQHGGVGRRTTLHSASSNSRIESSDQPIGGRSRGADSSWTESSIYVSRSTGGSSSSSTKLRLSSNPSLVGGGSGVSGVVVPRLPAGVITGHRKTTRTHSDSYQLEGGCGDSDVESGSVEHLLEAGSGRASDSAASLSLGSSLDNLLLVDSSSVQSGLSPNSGGSGSRPGAGNRISVSSNLSSGHLSTGNGNNHHGLASLSNYDPELEDGDVFVDPAQESGPESQSQLPPTLPEKQNRANFLLGRNGGPQGQGHGGQSHYVPDPRCPSPYENVDETDLATWHGASGNATSARDAFHSQQRHFMSYSESRNTLTGSGDSGRGGCGDDDHRPPLPPKKKHSLIAAYVEFLHNFESYSQQQHHTHFHNHLNAIHHQHLAASAAGNGGGGDDDGVECDPLNVPPGDADTQRRAFRAERSATLANPGGLGIVGGGFSRSAYSFHHINSNATVTTSFGGANALSEEDVLSPSPALERETSHSQFQFQPLSPSSDKSERSWASGGGGNCRGGNEDEEPTNGIHPPPALPPKRSKHFLGASPAPPVTPSVEENAPSPARNSGIVATSPAVGSHPPVLTPVHSINSASPQLSIEEFCNSVTTNNDLYLTDVFPSLIPNESLHNQSSGSTSSSSSARGGSSGSDGPEVKGGDPHLLIVYAASPNLKDVRFREVFLLTYRTFVRPIDAVTLLWRRYQHFHQGRNNSDRLSLLHARATLDLWVDVVNSLTPKDLEAEMVSQLREYIYHLVSCGEIQSALKARKGLIQKYSIRQKLLSPKPPPVSLAVTSETQSLLQWGATSIAQQMTLLDAELFRQLEPAELLLWAREQSEDFCPALNYFTEHFNKVSYWARSKVLLCANSRERNRTMKKMIEVMRKLREYNNFNSLLAVLAALDSAPIRRLGFSRRLTEALKPHAALTDSSGSFRTYRQALAESKPPCIPYIGLVLQDLTFVDIGNADLLPDGKVNWVKRWQQWVVLEPGRRFHSCNYGFVRNDPLLTFLNNFDESLNDDELWQLSESIKPRSKNY